MAINILLINKDELFAESLRYSLEEDEYKIDESYSIKDALEKIKNNKYDLVLLDLILPDGNGLTLCQNIRKNSDVPIIILTEEKDPMSKVLALNYGADDYVTKPFNILELKARINAILRRIYTGEESKAQILQLDDFKINAFRRRVKLKDKLIDLTGKEFDLFYILISNPGKVFTRDELLKKVWGYDYFASSDLRTVDVHIRRLREKVEKDSKNVEYINTKWGKGYYFRKKHDKN